MATPGSDPFSGTNSRNILQHMISPKLVANATGGYDAKVDLINVDNVYLTNNITSKMLATYDGQNIITSDDYGESWTRLNTNSTFTLNTCTAIRWNGKIWVAVGGGGNGILTSLDAIKWTASSNGFDGYGSDVIWNGEIWVAVGRGTHSLLISSDGMAWRYPANELSPTYALYGINYSRGRWVAAGSILATGGGVIFYSDDAETWTASETNFSYASYDVVSDGNIWVAVGQQMGGGGNTILYSTDNAINWSNTTGTKFDGEGTVVVYHSGQFVAVGQDTRSRTILWSSDGKDWNVSTGPLFSNYGDTVVWNGKRWVSSGNNLSGSTPILISDDGKTWVASSGEKIPISGVGNSFGLGTNNIWETLPTSLNDIISKFANSLNNLSGRLI